MTTFSTATIEFLKNLRENNNREWFEKNRDDYEANLLLPMKHIAMVMEPVMKSIDPLLDTSPKRAVSRIYRDIRFSLDKTPYRKDAWVTFKRPKTIMENAPELFLYFTDDSYEIGMGYYAPTPASMARFRNNILLDPEGFGEFLDRFEARDDIGIYGEDYKKRIPNDLPDRFQPWFQKRKFYVSRSRRYDELFFSDKLPEIMAEVFYFLSVAYGFLIDTDE